MVCLETKGHELRVSLFSPSPQTAGIFTEHFIVPLHENVSLCNLLLISLPSSLFSEVPVILQLDEGAEIINIKYLASPLYTERNDPIQMHIINTSTLNVIIMRHFQGRREVARSLLTKVKENNDDTEDCQRM